MYYVSICVLHNTADGLLARSVSTLPSRRIQSLLTLTPLTSAGVSIINVSAVFQMEFQHKLHHQLC